jgi:glutathione S-transferase
MELYFSPLACSMATRIAIYELDVAAVFREVDPKTKRVLDDGSDFRAVNPLGLVPTLRTDDGAILTENAAILQYVAERSACREPTAGDGFERTRLQQWLCFIGTELHKALFTPLLDPKAPNEVKAYALHKGAGRLNYLDKYLEGRAFVLDDFSVADAYLTTVLNWTVATPQIELREWAAVGEYLGRMRQRPSISRAIKEEFALYRAEQERHKSAA